jgi:signal transduction histidine kinase
MISQRRPVPILLAQLFVLFLQAIAGYVDLMSGFSSDAFEIVGPVRVLLALATAAVYLPRWRPESQVLPALALGLAGWSIMTTALMVIFAGGGGSWGVAEAGGLIAVLITVARRGAMRLAVPSGALLLFALFLEPFRNGNDSELVAFGLFQALVGVAGVVAGAYPRYQADTRIKQLAMAKSEQRAEFARDLHDFVAHHVTGIVVQAQGARYVADQDPKRVIDALEQIENAGIEAMTAMRRMVAMLRSDAPTAPLAGIADLPTLVEGFTAAGGPPVRLHLDGDLDHLPIEVTTSAYRVVMEALTNVRQHAAGASEVVVHVQHTPDWLIVHVADDGAPLPGSSRQGSRQGTGHGFGLLGLTERVQSVGGWLHAGPAVSRGWQVDARLPLKVTVA